MFGLDTLNVLIGLVTVYLAFGVACTAIVEAIAAWLGLRSGNLETAMRELFAGQLDPSTPFATAFYAHPLVQALSKGRNGRPSYIPPEIVGQVVESLITANGTVASLAAAVNALPDTPDANRIKGLLAALVAQTGEDAAAFRRAVETHFDAVMDRASGWFKRYAQNVALGASAVLVVGANVDTLELASSLASSPAARTKIVEIAQGQVRSAETAEKSTEEEIKAGTSEGGLTLAKVREQSEAARAALDLAASNLEAAGLRFGWQESPSTVSGWLAKGAGLAVSLLAVSLGAPFWFSVLQGFMQVRAAGVSPREKKPAAS
jgi:hypothetical protein